MFWSLKPREGILGLCFVPTFGIIEVAEELGESAREVDDEITKT